MNTATTYARAEITNQSQHCTIRKCVFAGIDPQGYENDGLDIVQSSYNLIDSCSVSGCGHYGISVHTHDALYNVIRANVVYAVHGGIESSQGDYTLVENNLVYYPNMVTFSGGTASQFFGSYCIIRKNTFLADTNLNVDFNGVSSVATAKLTFDHPVDHVRWYHNTNVIKTPGTALSSFTLDDWASTEGFNSSLQDNIVKNSILVGGDNEVFWYRKLITTVNDSIAGCLFAADTASGDSQTLIHLEVAGIQYNHYSLADAKTRCAALQNSNIASSPKFVNVTQRNYALQGDSPAIDNAVPLTWVVSGSGTSITVRDAGYFTDGWDNVTTGDSIKLGDDITKIIAIDGNVITTSSDVYPSAGAAVYLWPFSGARPDIGASEYIQPVPTYNRANLKADISANDIKLVWTPVPNVNGYSLTRNGSNLPSPSGSASSTTDANSISVLVSSQLLTYNLVAFDVYSRPLDTSTVTANVAPSSISSNTTWSGVMYLNSNVTIASGNTLTIQPGTNVVADTTGHSANHV